MDALDPKNSPKAPKVKSMNRLPIFIGLAFFMSFFIMVAITSVQKGNRAQSTADDDKKSSTASADIFANEITTGQNVGDLIPPADDPEAEPEKKDSEKEDPGKKTVPVSTSPKPPLPDFGSGHPLQQTRGVIRIQENELIENSPRYRMLQNALASKTSGDYNKDVQRPGNRVEYPSTSYEPSTGTTPGSTDVTQVYLERLNALKKSGILPSDAIAASSAPPSSFGSSDSGSKDDYSKFGGNENRWNLGNTVSSPPNKYIIRAGAAVIPAMLISGINSDLPGQVQAQVSQNIYDTATGKHLLIPQGTRLVGQYGSNVAYGQKRVMMAWQRLIFPDGKVLDIGTMPGADSAGFSGFKDLVHTHFWKTIGSAILMSGVIAGVTLSQDNDNDNDSDSTRASDALSEALGQTLGNTLAEMIRKNMNLSPTLEIRPGYRLNVMVTKDLVLPGEYRAFLY